VLFKLALMKEKLFATGLKYTLFQHREMYTSIHKSSSKICDIPGVLVLICAGNFALFIIAVRDMRSAR